jgi:hypothetical protein
VRNNETAPHATYRSAPRAATRAPALSTRAPAVDEEAEDETDEQAWQSIRTALERPGDLRDGILTFTVPRDDLEITVQGNDVPVGAGLASEFRFYRCPCGLINVIGQFVVADYEANDVLDAVRDGHIEIASVGPFLIHERPRLLLIRFFGEHKRGGHLAKSLRTALSWTGKERMAPQKIDRPG